MRLYCGPHRYWTPVNGVDAFDDFCRGEWPRLVGTLALYCGDAAVAEEFAQEALARAYDRWEQVGRLENPSAWVYRTAVNLTNSWFRRRRAERRALARHGTQGEHRDPDVGDAVALRAAVTALPRSQRDVLVLRYLYDCSVADTAALVGKSEGAVKQHAHRGLQALRTRFTRAGGER